MTIQFKFNGQTLTMEGPDAEIREALHGAFINNREFYLMAKDIVAVMMYDEVHDQVAAEIAGRQSSRIMKPRKRKNGKC